MAGAHLDSVQRRARASTTTGPARPPSSRSPSRWPEVKPRNKVRFACGAPRRRASSARRSTSAACPRQSTPRSRCTSTSTWSAARTTSSSSTTATTPTPTAPARARQVRRRSRRRSSASSARGDPFKGTDFTGRSDYGPFIANGIPSGGLFTGAEGIKTAEEAAIWGGTAGVAYDPCYHQACDTFANNNIDALDTNADAIAYATLQYAMNTSDVNGVQGKGNFKLPTTEQITGLSAKKLWRSGLRSRANEAGRGDSPGFIVRCATSRCVARFSAVGRSAGSRRRGVEGRGNARADTHNIRPARVGAPGSATRGSRWWRSVSLRTESSILRSSAPERPGHPLPSGCNSLTRIGRSRSSSVQAASGAACGRWPFPASSTRSSSVGCAS